MVVAEPVFKPKLVRPFSCGGVMLVIGDMLLGVKLMLGIFGIPKVPGRQGRPDALGRIGKMFIPEL